MISYNINSLVGKYEDVKLIKPPSFTWGVDTVASMADSFKDNSFVVVKDFLELAYIESCRAGLLEELTQMDLVNKDWSLRHQQGACFTGFEPLVNTDHFRKLAFEIQYSTLLSSVSALGNNLENQLVQTKYVRCLGKMQEVSLHCDFYRFNKSPITTAWIPLTPADIKSGTLVFKSGAYTIDQLDRQIQGSEIPLAFAESIEQGSSTWLYMPLNLGDIVLISPNVLYGTFRNDSHLMSAHAELRWLRTPSLDTTSSR